MDMTRPKFVIEIIAAHRPRRQHLFSGRKPPFRTSSNGPFACSFRIALAEDGKSVDTGQQGKASNATCG
jgi:hypothetical protein